MPLSLGIALNKPIFFIKKNRYGDMNNDCCTLKIPPPILAFDLATILFSSKITYLQIPSLTHKHELGLVKC